MTQLEFGQQISRKRWFILITRVNLELSKPPSDGALRICTMFNLYLNPGFDIRCLSVLADNRTGFNFHFREIPDIKCLVDILIPVIKKTGEEYSLSFTQSLNDEQNKMLVEQGFELVYL